MSSTSDGASAKYGPHGDLVAEFLQAVSSGGLNWQQVVADSRPPERRSAIQAVGKIPWPAARLAAVDKAGLDAFAALGLSRSDFAHPLDLGALKVAISAGSKAVAVCDRVGVEVVRTLLQPFANQRVDAADEAIARASSY
ncbi:hypothetical protein ACFUMH_04330 [Cellulomonas sp. NPDC057328]|uniref:hypothetical protein n=1 Tax=Cellulomonas sp. NPDC057328 TaxID=3346101 RepID=UPI00362CA009